MIHATFDVRPFNATAATLSREDGVNDLRFVGIASTLPSDVSRINTYASNEHRHHSSLMATVGHKEETLQSCTLKFVQAGMLRDTHD